MKRAGIDWGWVKKELLEREKISSIREISQRKILTAVAEECIDEAITLARPRVASAKAPWPIGFSGKRLVSYFSGACHIQILLATVGGGIEEAATRRMKDGDDLGGYLLDRIGSFAVESLAESAEDDLRKIYALKAMSVSMRYSPGYCDLPIEEQLNLAKLLSFSKAGITLTESCMMVPRKSISAILGVGPKGLFKKGLSQCRRCDRKDCNYRRS